MSIHYVRGYSASQLHWPPGFLFLFWPYLFFWDLNDPFLSVHTWGGGSFPPSDSPTKRLKQPLAVSC